MKIIKNKNVYQLSSIIIFIIGIYFVYLIAEADDAPGFIFFGTAVVSGACLLLFGIGALIKIFENNNKILNDIYKKLKIKNK